MMRILIDTNILIDYLRIENKKDSAFYKLFLNEGKIPVISHVSITELYAGKSSLNKKAEKLIEDLVEIVEAIYPDKTISKKTGEILRQTGGKISFQDAQIAACAIINGLPIFTKNKKDFAKIQGIRFFN